MGSEMCIRDRARVVRAERLATLGNLAWVVVALNIHGVGDRSVAIRATDGVAQPLLW